VEPSIRLEHRAGPPTGTNVVSVMRPPPRRPCASTLRREARRSPRDSEDIAPVASFDVGGLRRGRSLVGELPAGTIGLPDALMVDRLF